MTTFPSLTEPKAYVACRTLGHAWDDIPVPGGIPRPTGTVPLWLRCTRCYTERHDLCSRFTGDVESRQYQYPEHYHHSQEEGLTRSGWRGTYLRLLGVIPARTANTIIRENRKVRGDGA